MRFSKWFFVGTILTASAALVACASSDDGAESDGDGAALTGSLTGAKACAVESAYQAADLSAITAVTFFQLPPAVQARVPTEGGMIDAGGKLNVNQIGVVYVIERQSKLTFIDATGVILATAIATDASAVWKAPDGHLLDCSGNGGSADASTPIPVLDASSGDPDASFGGDSSPSTGSDGGTTTPIADASAD